jgi:hypothetical protein
MLLTLLSHSLIGTDFQRPHAALSEIAYRGSQIQPSRITSSPDASFVILTQISPIEMHGGTQLDAAQQNRRLQLCRHFHSKSSSPGL